MTDFLKAVEQALPTNIFENEIMLRVHKRQFQPILQEVLDNVKKRASMYVEYYSNTLYGKFTGDPCELRALLLYYDAIANGGDFDDYSECSKRAYKEWTYEDDDYFDYISDPLDEEFDDDLYDY